jgi:hypothetical protein
MKASIFVRNLENRIFEFDNTQECTLNCAIKLEINRYRGTKEYDAVKDFDVAYIASPNTMNEVLVVVHKADSEEEAHFIIQTIFKKIKEKSDLFMQRMAIKKIKGLDDSVLEMIQKDIRDNYFELKIEDIIKEFKSK